MMDMGGMSLGGRERNEAVRLDTHQRRSSGGLEAEEPPNRIVLHSANPIAIN